MNHEEGKNIINSKTEARKFSFFLLLFIIVVIAAIIGFIYSSVETTDNGRIETTPVSD